MCIVEQVYVLYWVTVEIRVQAGLCVFDLDTSWSNSEQVAVKVRSTLTVFFDVTSIVLGLFKLVTTNTVYVVINSCSGNTMRTWNGHVCEPWMRCLLPRPTLQPMLPTTQERKYRQVLTGLPSQPNNITQSLILESGLRGQAVFSEAPDFGYHGTPASHPSQALKLPRCPPHAEKRRGSHHWIN